MLIINQNTTIIMKQVSFYIMAGVLFLLSLWWFFCGYNGWTLPVVSVFSEISMVVILAIGLVTLDQKDGKKRRWWTLALFMLGLILLSVIIEMDVMFQNFVASQVFLRFGSIILFAMALQVLAIPVFIKYGNLKGLLFVFLEAAVAIIFSNIIRHMMPFVLDNPFVTKDFNLMTSGIFALFLVELGITIICWGIKIILGKYDLATDEDGNNLEFKAQEQECTANFLDFNPLFPEDGANRIQLRAFDVNTDENPKKNKGLGYFLVVVGVLLFPIAAVIIYSSMYFL